MSTLKVNKIRDTAGSADAIVLDPSGGVKMSGICTATTFDGDATSLTQIPAANLVGVCTSGLTRTGGFGKFASYAIIADQKSQNTDAGTFTSGDWRTRDLNTELSDEDGIVSISSNQFTLGAGSYLIIGKAPAYDCNRHQVRIQNITDSTTTGSGTPLYNHTSYNPSNMSEVTCRTIISTSKVFELQHYAQTTKASNGLGLGGNFGVEIYATVQIYKES